jgi:peptide/bleomycin uptake transporter
MFQSFFPRPALFFGSGVLWTALAAALWYIVAPSISALIGLPFPEAGTPPVIGLGYFATNDFLFFYLYFLAMTAIFAGLWFRFSPHPWQRWSILGSALIYFTAYLDVQVAVAINHWRKPFFDKVQFALSGEEVVTSAELYGLIFIFTQIAIMAVIMFVFTNFFASHYLFRWRHAMTDYYFRNWDKLRHIEGASQRIQEDTKRFASIMETLGVSILLSILTLVAFIPVLIGLSVYVNELPIIGPIANALMLAAIFWSLFGTFLLAAVGIKLPGLEFRNQRVEAAFRKELVYGEDDEERAQPVTVWDLFGIVRRNYFRLFFHYLYFNIARSVYLQADNIYGYFIMIPTIIARQITLGILQQILTAFTQVTNSFQLIVNSWPTIIELISIYKRLLAFEAVLRDKDLPQIDIDYSQGIDPDAD